MTDAATFLRALYDQVPCGYAELRPAAAPSVFLPLPLTDTAALDAHLAMLERASKWQPFFGVAPRLDATAGGRIDNCFCITALVADIDFKRHGEEAALDAITCHPVSPSAVLSTGGGFHIYYFLDEPLYDVPRASRLLLAFGATVPLSDAVFDVPRVLRLPGTLNRKYDPPRRAQLEVFEPDRRYGVEALEQFAGVPAEVAQEGIGLLEARAPFEPSVMFDEGSRHAELFRFMRSAVTKYSLDWSELWPLMQAVNARRCDPALSERELHSFLRRAFDTPHSTGFDR